MAAYIGNRGKVKHLVVDSSALIRNVPVHEIGENIYTVENVVKEIKDKATRQSLQVLPYELKFKIPLPEDVIYVTNFTKKTGDYSSLSAVDIHLLALTYTLAKQNNAADDLKKEPSQGHVVTSQAPGLGKPLFGFFIPSDEESESSEEVKFKLSEERNESENFECKLEDEDVTLYLNKLNEHGHVKETSNENSEENLLDENMKHGSMQESSDKNVVEVLLDGNVKTLDKTCDGDLVTSECEESEGIQNDDGWITADNICEAKNQMGALSLDDSPVTVACITTDFAMQNVLMQMGLPVISTDGMLIKRAKTFILRCYSCFKTTSIMTKQFCPNCGNKTLKRVAVTVDENGEKALHINFRRPINIRGTKYSLPAPKGGKHANNPVLCEDQPLPQNRPSKKGLKKVDVFDPDYQAFASPFAIHDIYSRAGSLGIYGKQVTNNRHNPNEKKKHTGNRKNK